jgi:hypothetical protein
VPTRAGSVSWRHLRCCKDDAAFQSVDPGMLITVEIKPNRVVVDIRGYRRSGFGPAPIKGTCPETPTLRPRLNCSADGMRSRIECVRRLGSRNCGRITCMGNTVYRDLAAFGLPLVSPAQPEFASLVHDIQSRPGPFGSWPIDDLSNAAVLLNETGSAILAFPTRGGIRAREAGRIAVTAPISDHPASNWTS